MSESDSAWTPPLVRTPPPHNNKNTNQPQHITHITNNTPRHAPMYTYLYRQAAPERQHLLCTGWWAGGWAQQPGHVNNKGLAGQGGGTCCEGGGRWVSEDGEVCVEQRV